MCKNLGLSNFNREEFLNAGEQFPKSRTNVSPWI